MATRLKIKEQDVHYVDAVVFRTVNVESFGNSQVYVCPCILLTTIVQSRNMHAPQVYIYIYVHSEEYILYI